MKPEETGKSTARFGIIKIGLCIAGIAWLFWPSQPAIIRIGEPGSIRGEVLLFIANPLRDRAPEETTERLLLMLRQGRCIEAFKFAGEDDALIKEACNARAASLPVLRWKFIDRVDHKGIVNPQYRCELRAWEEYMSVKLMKSGNEWRTVSWAFPPGA
ncbi:MAG: hypothetical protein HYX27_02760 [Acidobacteria bacterium]|nr:hypothetical protein [Acidobacteriota bacterium]